jgi:hypothetical protein
MSVFNVASEYREFHLVWILDTFPDTRRVVRKT